MHNCNHHNHHHDCGCVCREPYLNCLNRVYHNNSTETLVPASGPIRGNCFTVIDTMPYLIDTNNDSYGHQISVADVVTHACQRKDPSCVNVVATFNMMDNNLPNNDRVDKLLKHIAEKYNIIHSILPVIKKGIKFTLYYDIHDVESNKISEGTFTSFVNETHLHFTDIKDLFIESCKGAFINNITVPDEYKEKTCVFHLSHIEASVYVINTYANLTDPDVNPYYKFTNNNELIQLDDDYITTENFDNEITIGFCNVDKSYEFISNLTNRIHITFTTFMSSRTIMADTTDVYSELFTPTTLMIDQMRKDLDYAMEEIQHLHSILHTQNELIQKQNEIIKQHSSLLEEHTTKISSLEELNADLIERIEKLESIPLAIIRYANGVEFVRGQLTYSTYGVMYQVAKDFTVSESISDAVKNGNLIRLK